MEQKGKFTFSFKSSLNENVVLIEKGGSNPVSSPMADGIYGDNKEHQS